MKQMKRSGFIIAQAFRLERCIAAALKACYYIAAVIFVATGILTVVHVIGRYGFDKPVPGIVEVTCYATVVAVFLLLAPIMIEESHVKLEIIIDRFPKIAQAIIDSISYLIGLALSILAFWKTLELGIYISDSRLKSATLLIPAGPFYIMAAIGWGLLSLAVIIRLVHIIAVIVTERKK